MSGIPVAVTLERLRTFVAVAEAGSFRRAGDQLGLSQSSISQQLQHLESALGLTLFHREARGARLTSQGHAVLPRARELLDDAERLGAFAQSLLDAERGLVAIACYPVHLERFLAEVIGRFREERPDVRIDLTKLRDDRRRDSGRSLFDELREGLVDLAMGPPHPDLGLHSQWCYDARIVVLYPDEHPNRHRAGVSVLELKEERVLAAPRGFFSREKLAAACAGVGFDLHVEIESASPPALAALGRRGLGLAVLPDDYQVVRDPRFPYPVVETTTGEPLLTPVELQWRADRPLTPNAEAVVRIARELATTAGT